MTAISTILRAVYDGSTLPNQIANHSCQDASSSTSGWDAGAAQFYAYISPNSTPVPGFYRVIDASSTLFGKSTAFALWRYDAASAAASVRTPAAPVRPGQFLSWSINLGDADGTQGWKHWAKLNWYNAAGGLISSTAEVSAVRSGNGYGTVTLGAGGVTVPAGAATCKIEFRSTTAAGAALPYSNSGTATSYSTFATMIMIVTSATSGPVAARVAFAEPTWTEITGSSVNLRINRGGDVDGVLDEIEAGTLTLEAIGSSVDPKTNPTLRRGRALRIEFVTADPLGNSVALIVTEIDTVDARYAEDKGRKPPRVVITASDAVAQLRGVPQPVVYVPSSGASGFSPVAAAIRQNILASGLYQPSYNYGSQANPGNGGVVAGGLVDDATVWDQLMLARNSYPNAKVWITAGGKLGIQYATTARDQTVTLSGDAGAAQSFTDLDLSLDSRTLVNSLTITLKNNTVDGGSKDFGPYQNQASISDWGPVSAAVETSSGDPLTLATYYLQRFASAAATVHAVSFDMLRMPNSWRYLDLYDKARIILTSAGIDATSYIIGIEHTITATSWRTTFRLRPEDTRTADVISQPAAGANTGAADVVAADAAPLGSRWLAVAQAIANTTITTIAYDTSVNADGGIAWDDTNKTWTVPRTGRYLLSASVTFAAMTTGVRYCYSAVNGVTTNRRQMPTDGSSFTYNQVIKLNANDTVAMRAYQSSGAALNLLGSTNRENSATLSYLGS